MGNTKNYILIGLVAIILFLSIILYQNKVGESHNSVDYTISWVLDSGDILTLNKDDIVYDSGGIIIMPTNKTDNEMVMYNLLPGEYKLFLRNESCISEITLTQK